MNDTERRLKSVQISDSSAKQGQLDDELRRKQHDLQLQEDLKTATVKAEELVKNLDPLTELVKSSLANNTAYIRSGNKSFYRAESYYKTGGSQDAIYAVSESLRQVVWNVTNGAADKIGLIVDNNGDVAIHVGEDYMDSLHDRIKTKKPNMKNQGWEEEILDQVAKIAELGLHHATKGIGQEEQAMEEFRVYIEDRQIK